MMTTMTLKKPEILVVYHAGCMDGLVAAWICWRKWGPHAEYLPMGYERVAELHIDDVELRTVFVLDFSFPPEQTLEICKAARKVVWIDHHESAIKAWETYHNNPDRPETPNAILKLEVTLDQSHSGCRLTWLHFFGNDPAPWLVEYAEDRDLWRWALPQSKQVNAALRAYPWDFETLERLAGMPTARDLVREGAAILMAERRIVERQAAEASPSPIGNYPDVPTVNATALVSETLEELLRLNPEAKLAASWRDDKVGTRHWSLRSGPGGANVAEVARGYGGGGHEHAAGFTQASGS